MEKYGIQHRDYNQILHPVNNSVEVTTHLSFIFAWQPHQIFKTWRTISLERYVHRKRSHDHERASHDVLFALLRKTFAMDGRGENRAMIFCVVLYRFPLKLACISYFLSILPLIIPQKKVMKKLRPKTSSDLWRERAWVLEKENILLRKENVLLKARVNDLEDKITILLARVDQLENQIRKDSNNSSKPPSSDMFKEDIKKNQSLREKSWKMSWWQKGRTWVSRSQVADPDTVIECIPEACISCGKDFQSNPWISSSILSRRQEVDIPPIRPIVTEYQRIEVVCDCGKKSCGTFPSHITGWVQFGNTLTSLVSYLHGAHYIPYDRMSTILSDILGVSVSEGSIENLLERTHTKTRWFMSEILRIIKTGHWVGSDETGDRVNGQTFWRWVWQNILGSYYVFDEKRSYDVVFRNFREDYKGTVVHDCHGAQNNTVAWAHQHCHAHYLRDIEFIIESRRCPWAYRVKHLLLSSQRAQRVMWQNWWDDERRIAVRAYYQSGLRSLIETTNVTSKESRTFQKRLRKHEDKVFHFLSDPTIPFHNNSSEQAIRNAKIHKKISGCFRSLHGAKRNSDLLTFIETVKKHKRPILESLQLALAGKFYFCVE